MDAKSFGKKLREIRKERGLTLIELGERTSLSQPYLSQIENGLKGIPSPEILRKLAEPLRVEFEELMIKAGHLPADYKEHIVRPDPVLKEYLQRLAAADNPLEREKLYRDAAELLHGRAIGKWNKEITYGVGTQEEASAIDKLSDKAKHTRKLFVANRDFLEELLKINPHGLSAFWSNNKEIFDNRDLTLELLDELTKTRDDDSVSDLINHLLEWSRDYMIEERNGNETRVYTQSQWNEITEYLKRQNITYNGHPLDKDDRKRILITLEQLFPDRKRIR